MNEHRERDIGQRVDKFLSSDEWRQAFQTYRQFILSEIEREDDEKRVMKLKAHLHIAKAVQTNLESLVKNGAIAAKTIEIEEKRRGFRGFLPWQPK